MVNLTFNDMCLTALQYLKPDQAKTLISIFALLVIGCVYHRRRWLRTPRLQGPRSESLIYGVTERVLPSPYLGLVYRDWEQTYGPVYEIPAGMGSRHVILSDPKAIAHLLSKDTTTYHRPAMASNVARKLFGDLITAVEGETHKRQRRVLSSAFSISAIRELTPVFLNSARELKAAWDSSFQSSDGSTDAITIDVQKWMNYVALDSIGDAGFSHDFGALRGETSPVMTSLTFLNTVRPSYSMMFPFLLKPLFSIFFANASNKRQERLVEAVTGMKVLASELLNKISNEAANNNPDRSILGVMIRSESSSSNIRLSADEIIAQINMFISAGYETTATTLTWAIIELARHPEIQATLRVELRNSFTDVEDIAYDQLTSLAFLDAFIHEVLRLHPASPTTRRVAKEDDTVPLTKPIQTASGAMADSLFVAKGTVIRIPFACVNISETLWGPDATTFNPNRWLGSGDVQRGRKEEVKGYRNLLTFAYGPRMCPGRNFVIAEIKVVLSVLVRSFSFEFSNGPSTKLEHHFLRPKVAGEEGSKVPVVVRRVMS